MERSWYLRLGVVLLAVLGGLIVLWPTAYYMSEQSHRVGEGETVEEIAERYDADPARLREINGLVVAGENRRTLEPETGQLLRIPGTFPIPDFILENVNRRITPGLDIQGGLRMMYTVDMDAATEDRRNTRAQQLIRQLGEKMDIVEEDEAPDEAEMAQIRARVSAQSSPANLRLIRLVFENPRDLALVDRDLVRSFGDLTEDGRDDDSVTFILTEESLEELRTLAVNQAQETIKNRIAELGIQEGNVRAQDIDISVEVPGASEQQFDRIREIISQTAQLEFKIVDDANTFAMTLRSELPDGIALRGSSLFAEGPGVCPEGVERPDAPSGQCTAHTRLKSFVETVVASGRVPGGRMFAIGRAESDEERAPGEGGAEPDAWTTYVLYEQPPNGSDPVGGEHLEDARVASDPQTGSPLVTFATNAEGARRMQALTSANLQKRMAIVLDDEVASAPVIQGAIGAQGQITLGGFRDFNTLQQEAHDLVVVLRAGALPAPIIAQNEQYIGPTLGRDAVEAGALGALIGILLVLVFMGLYYSAAGLVADVMVVLNVFLLFGIMAFFNNDLTLPGIAGIALTVGMAVDANVLLNERMREEVRIGKSPRAVVDQGFKRAFWSIFDSQFTTFIAAVVLYQFGSPEIQGFARTLMIGIVTSLFTGVFCSRVMFDWLVKGLKVSTLKVG